MAVYKHKGRFTWDQVEVLKYKEEGTHFKDITRQILFAGQKELAAQLRYFEIKSQGHSTLERHAHVHVVMVIQGKGKALVGTEVLSLKPYDVIHIPPRTWHQFRATGQRTFGFLCLVASNRDRPERPDAKSLRHLSGIPGVAKFIKI